MPKFKKETQEVEVAELCQLLNDFIVATTIDLGSTILHVGEHVHLGRLVLVSTACGRAACIPM
jgi:hypothetical protein